LASVTIETFDGSGESVHPDAVTTQGGWGPTIHDYLVATPYPGGNATYENPSFYAGGTSILSWHIPDGAQNPVVRPNGGYLSDPDQLYNPVTNEIWLYYRHVSNANEIFLVRSSDGVHWSAPLLVLSVPNHQAVSPTVVRKSATDWWMWTVNSGGAGCSSSSTTVELRKSTDGMTWSAPTTVELTVLGTESPWHIDVTWVEEYHEFWAVYNAKTPGSCTTQLLRLAKSADGVHWETYGTPLLQRGAIPEFKDVVYRASLSYNPIGDLVTLWYSGAKAIQGRYTWRLAVQQMKRATMFGIASGELLDQSRSDVGASPPSSDADPLTNETAP